MRTLAGALIAGLLWSAAGWGAISGQGTTAAAFLKIGVGPRAVAMGEAFTAAVDDATSVYWNPAGLAQITTPEISAMHVFWFQDTSFEYLGGALPLPVGAGGVSLVYLNNGILSRSQAGDTPDSPDRGTFTSQDVGFTAAYGLQYDASLSLGGALKLFSETIDSQSSLGWALDIGFRYLLPWPGLALGFVVQNLGPATRVDSDYFRLPVNFKIGFAYRPVSVLLLTLDYNQLLEQNPKIGLGAEYLFEDYLALRAGYFYQSSIDNNEYFDSYGTNAAAGLSAGIGVHYSDFRLDYAFVPYGFLGSAHRIALTYDFSQPPVPVPVMPAAAQPLAPAPKPTAAPTPGPTPVAALPPAAQELKKGLEDIDRRIAVGELARVQFAIGQADLTERSKKTLGVVATWLDRFPGIVVRIGGHTDSQGVPDNNLKLSQARVDSVKAYLVAQYHIDPARIQAVGFGQTQPIANNKTAAGRTRNRRVEFKVVNQDYR